MLSKEVTDKDGNKRVVMADTEDDLKAEVANVKAQKVVASPDINTPVERGHDKLEVAENFSTKMVDGTDGRQGLQAPELEHDPADAEEVVEEDAHVAPGPVESDAHVEKTDDPTE